MKLKHCISMIFITLLIFFSNLQSQTYRFENLTSDDGLSQNTVLCIYQDSRNFIWFGTYDGLNRYDGYKFRVYKSDKRKDNSISGQSFTSIIEDRQGNLWIGSLGGGLNRYNRLMDNFTTFRHIQNDSTSIPNNRIRAFLIDKSGKFWIGTEGGLCIYDFEMNKFSTLNKTLGVENNVFMQYVTSICEDDNANIWIGTYSGLIKYNPVSGEKKYYTNEYDNPNTISGNYIGKVYKDNKNNIWIGTGEGLNKYDAVNDLFIRYENEYLLKSNDRNIKDIVEDNSGNLWIATNLSGLLHYDRRKNSFTNYQYNPFDKTSISSNIIHSIIEDKTGIIWIGTEGGGVNKLIRRKSQFNYYSVKTTGDDGLSNNNVYAVIEDKNEDLWIGTFGGGVNKFEPKKKKNRFTIFNYEQNNPNSLIDNRIRTMFLDNEEILWIGTDNGLTEYNTTTGKIINHSETFPNSINNRAIFSILQLSSGEILIGTFGGGINIFDKKKRTFSYIKHNSANTNSLSSDMIWRIFEDSKGRIWIGTENDGLDLFDRKNNIFHNYNHDPNNPKSISSNMVLTILEDKNGDIWLGTTQGLNKAVINDITKEITFINYSINEGLPDNNVQGMLEDNKGNIWISTNKGLSKFNPFESKFENYDINDGLLSNEFFVNSCSKRKNGELIFGGNKGFIVFHPDSIRIDTTKPKVMITDFLLYNSTVPINESIDDNIILKQNITETREIVLSYSQNVLSFEFSALHFSAPNKNTYAYIMEGLEYNWNYSGNRNFATYSKIPPGEYIFKVKAANPNNIWSDDNFELRIKILPPFYETIWFRILGIIFIGLMIYSGYLWKINNIKRRQTELEGLINEKTELNEKLIKEINERKEIEHELIIAKEKAEGSERLKSEFLAQMSHEIRSPVNTILNFTDLIKETIENEKDEIIKESFESIENAGERIVRTIDLILNMSELQTGSYKCIYKEIDLKKSVLERLHSEFTYKANKKKIELILNIKTKELMIEADEYSVTQIFVNLIDNAIKYTNKGKVEITAEVNKQNDVVVNISDTGIGMSEEYMKNLFLPFNQEQTGYSRQYEGNGLGLALVKKYCEMNNALINVKSKKGEGSTFTVIFNKNNQKKHSPTNL